MDFSGQLCPSRAPTTRHRKQSLASEHWAASANKSGTLLWPASTTSHAEACCPTAWSTLLFSSRGSDNTLASAKDPMRSDKDFAALMDFIETQMLGVV